MSYQSSPGRPCSRIVLSVAVLFLLLPLTIRAQNDGADLFKSKCAACHGANGDGNTAIGKNMKLRDLRSDDVQKQSDAELKMITSDGKGKMPAYKGKVTDDQINQLVLFMRSLAAKK